MHTEYFLKILWDKRYIIFYIEMPFVLTFATNIDRKLSLEELFEDQQFMKVSINGIYSSSASSIVFRSFWELKVILPDSGILILKTRKKKNILKNLQMLISDRRNLLLVFKKTKSYSRLFS